MAIQNINDVLIANEIKEKIKNNSASSLPLNPSAQGWSATKIREKLYRAVCSESGDLDDNLLDVLATKLSTIKGILEILDAEVDLKADQTSLELLFSQLEDGIITVDKADKDGDGLVIKSNYGSALSLSYDENTNKITIRLYSSDNTLLDTKYITLHNATQSASGLMSLYDKTNLDTLVGLLGVIGGDADSTVNKIREVLDIFDNYPETDNLLDVLATKATKEELATAGFPNGWTRELLTSTALTNGQTISKETLEAYDIITLIAINTNNGEIDTDTIDTAVGLVDAYKYIFFDNASVFLTIGATCTFTDTVGGYQLKIIGQKYVAQEAENVVYDETSNVKVALDSVLKPTYENVLHEDLITEITATDDVEIIDDSGELVKITGNLIDGIIRDVDLGSVISGTGTWVTLSKNQFNLGTSKTNFAIQLDSTHTYWTFIKWKSFDESKTTFNMSAQDNAGTLIQNVAIKPVNLITSVFWKPTTNRTFNAWFYFLAGNNISSTEIDYHIMLDLEELKSSTILSDDGVMLKDLSEAEVKEQLTIWGQQGFPTKINKIVSKSDNLFDSEFYDLTDLESENLVSNSDLLIPKASPNENEPLGFQYERATDISLTNGIAKFTATARHGFMNQSFGTIATNDTYYAFARFKAQNSSVKFLSTDGTVGGLSLSHIGDNNFHFYSGVYTQTITKSVDVRVVDFNNSPNFTPIEVDYIGVVNITDLVSRGILPSGLTDAQYKAILDSACNRSHTPMVNVPLRESDFISVEPSVAYRLIKASENGATHKVIEYATDNQIVKVNSVDYSGNIKISAPITMNALTRKIKLVSDLMNRVPNLVSNSDLLIPKASPNENEPLRFTYRNATDISLVNGIAKFTATARHGFMNQSFGTIATNDTYYAFARFKAQNSSVKFLSTDGTVGGLSLSHIGDNNFHFYSGVYTQTITKSVDVRVVDFNNSPNFTPIEVDYIGAYNITTFINAGVVNDTGTLFSRLTNDEIKEQMDIWVQNGFPDHVIHALYPNGVDSAIAIKYNDADNVFRPQQIDELPLGITLRSGEYWQDGYIVKQNGNAEYYPLSTTLSAWNYGQLEAVYDSGIPADFTIKFAQNTNAQVQTNSDYLIEARESLDTLRKNQELLIEKLGVDVEADDYDSFVGITSAEYEYFGLEGIEEGDELNIDAYGQGVLNLLPNTITTTQTAVGLTITYDDATGTFTVNGTSTGANNFILKTGMVLGLPQGTTVQLMRYFVDGTVNLNGSYIGYLLGGTSVSNRINENSESLYDPYINASGDLKASGALSSVAGTSGQSLIFQVYASGMVFTDFKFKLGVFEGLTLQPFVMPSVSNSTAVDVYNHTANKLNTAFTTTTTSGITVTYDPLSQEYIFDGTASGADSITLSTNLFSVKSGDRLSIKRLYQSGDITPVSALPSITLISGSTTIVSNSIYKMTAPEGQTPTPDVTFNSGTASADLTNVTLKLSFASGDVFNSYRCRIMIHDKSSDIGYVGYSSTKIGSISLEAKARGKLSFTAIEFGILSFVPQTDKLNVVFGTSLTDLTKTNLEYNAGIQSPNRRISELNERLSNVDNVFRDKVIAIWGDSRESNNPTSDPEGVGDQKDTSYPAILAKKLGATVLNFGLSGGAWAENTFQQDAESAIVNRVLTEDTSASADIILISSMNDFKLATPLGSPATSNKTASTFYGAMRLTYDRLATKYPAKKIWLVLPQKRYDETTNYGGGSYLAYRKAQIEVAREYGIQTIDLYNNFANGGGGNTAPTFPTTTMLNATHFTAIGNDIVAELIARALLGNGNSGSVDVIPPLPTTAGTYTLKVVISEQGIPTFSWTVDE